MALVRKNAKDTISHQEWNRIVDFINRYERELDIKSKQSVFNRAIITEATDVNGIAKGNFLDENEAPHDGDIEIRCYTDPSAIVSVIVNQIVQIIIADDGNNYLLADHIDHICVLPLEQPQSDGKMAVKKLESTWSATVANSAFDINLVYTGASVTLSGAIWLNVGLSAQGLTLLTSSLTGPTRLFVKDFDPYGYCSVMPIFQPGDVCES